MVELGCGWSRLRWESEPHHEVIFGTSSASAQPCPTPLIYILGHVCLISRYNLHTHLYVRQAPPLLVGFPCPELQIMLFIWCCSCFLLLLFVLLIVVVFSCFFIVFFLLRSVQHYQGKVRQGTTIHLVSMYW